jgi:HTH-type transcriptional regulator/antitoxin HipB
MKKYTLDEIQDKYIGKKGTKKRDEFEFELNIELIGEMIKYARKQRNLTQEQLGNLVGVQKAQISKLETNAGNMTIDTVLKVFSALKAVVNLRVELLNKKIKLS